MKNKIIKIVLYIVGIFCIAYPIYSRFLAYKNQTESIYDYKKEIITMQQEELEEKRKKAEEGEQKRGRDKGNGRKAHPGGKGKVPQALCRVR